MRQGACSRQRMPVLMLEGSGAEDDVVRGLDPGAHDYLAKPVRLPVLIAQLRAQLRHHEHSTDAVLTVGPWRCQPAGTAGRGLGLQLGRDDPSLQTHIYRLRQKIEVDPCNARLLMTTDDGYQLAASVGDRGGTRIGRRRRRHSLALSISEDASCCFTPASCLPLLPAQFEPA